MIVFAGSLASGCIFDSDDGSVDAKKGSVSGTVKMAVTGEAVPGLTVYLVNKKAVIDTAGYDNNHVFADSATTDSEGKYSIGDIPPGEYAVAPVSRDSTTVYRFGFAAGLDSSGITVDGDAHSVNFIAEKMNHPGADGGAFTVTISLHADRQTHQFTNFTISRRKWILFIPYYDYSLSNTINSSPVDGYNFSLTCDRGFTAVLFTLDDYFRCTVEYREINGGALLSRTFEFGFPLGETPNSSKWRYDIATGALTRLP